MNFTKTKDIAADIFRMIRQIYENQSVSSLERDLLKEKLRRLYEAIDDLDEASGNFDIPLEKSQQILEKDAVTTVEPAVKVSAEMVEERLAAITELPEIDLTASLSFDPPKFAQSQRSVETPAASIGGVQNIETKVQLHEEPKIESVLAESELPESKIVEASPVVEPALEPIKIEGKSNVATYPSERSPEIDELFSFSEAKELLEKLRQTPVQDISKAFTLNERMLYAKELFGNNTEQMNLVLQKLNQLHSFEEAKNVLVEEVIFNFGWANKEKKKMAKEVIQVIKRRYLQP